MITRDTINRKAPPSAVNLVPAYLPACASRGAHPVSEGESFPTRRRDGVTVTTREPAAEDSLGVARSLDELPVSVDVCVPGTGRRVLRPDH